MGSLFIHTGNPFSGASVPAFNASSGSSGLQTASVAQNPFAANSATQGHTLGLAGRFRVQAIYVLRLRSYYWPISALIH